MLEPNHKTHVHIRSNVVYDAKRKKTTVVEKEGERDREKLIYIEWLGKSRTNKVKSNKYEIYIVLYMQIFIFFWKA